jgi:hypothetical protein
VGAAADGGEVLPVVVPPGAGPGGADEVGNRTDGVGAVEEVAEQFDDPAEGTGAAEHQAPDELAEEVLGDGPGEEDAAGGAGGRGIEGVVAGWWGLGGRQLARMMHRVVER